MIARWIIIALPIAAVPSLANAQSGDPAQVRLEGVAVPAAPAGATDLLVNGIDLSLSISEDESKASAQVGGYRVRDTNIGDGSGQTSMSWAVMLSVPIGGGDDLTSSSSIDALADGTKLTATVSFFGFKDAAHRLLLDPFYSDYMSRARATCEAEVRAVNTDIDAAAKEAINDCRRAGPSPDFVRQHRGATDEEVARSLFSGMWRAGVEASVAADHFEYFAPLTRAAQESTKAEFEAAAFAAYYFPNTRSAVLGRLVYQNGFEAADATVICKPAVIDPATDCIYGVPTAPRRVERLNLTAEGRWTFTLKRDGPSLGIAPKATLDTLSGEWEAEFPIYYIPAKGSPVSPGASLTYSSQKDEVDFRIFLRTSFAF